MVKTTFPNGDSKEFDEAVSGLEIAQSIGEGLARAALAVKVNGKVQDLSQKITTDSSVQILTFKDVEGKEVFWHSSAHVLAIAAKRIWPEIKLTIGPAIESGFYYDFEKAESFKDEDLEKIEAEMKKVVKEKLPFQRNEVTLDQAKKQFKDNKFKLEIIEDYKETQLTTYSSGDFSDLCSGPHVPNTGYIKSIKLLKKSSAYWRGDAKKESLQRIYGISFPDKKELRAHLEFLEEAKKRDHRNIAKKLKLYTISPLVGAGLPLFQPNGMTMRREIEDFLWDLHKHEGYQRVWTPHLAKIELYKTSGHYEHYKENFSVTGKENEPFMMKPMNCPHHMQLFADNHFSYKDMPIRYFEPATVYRDEISGTLSGLTRVRSITQDDGHLFCRTTQIKQEVATIVKIIQKFYKCVGMLDEYWVSLSVRDSQNSKDYIGSDQVWTNAENSLEEAAKEQKLQYKKVEGEAAFYGPKLDFMFKDAIGREHQLATIQLDFNLPERFDLHFINEDNKEERPVVIHRAIAGSLERNMGVLIEHFAGKFPLWLNPNQIMVLPVSEQYLEYAKEVQNTLTKLDLRADLDESSETVSKKVRNATMQYYNYILVVGEKEQAGKTVTIRIRDVEEQVAKSLKQFATDAKSEYDERR